MVRGLHQKWKKPFAYYFICGSTKADLLVKFLKEVLGACKNSGLQVVATVCDMDVYQWDKKNIVCLFYKLTDAHLAPVAQNAMKVSLAAHVMSHTRSKSKQRCFSR